MSWPPVSLRGVLRSAAVGVGGVAVAILLQHAWAEQPSAPALETGAAQSSAADVPRPLQATWTLQSGGWYIRVDGVEVQPPPVVSQPNPVPAPSRPTASLSAFDQLIAHQARAEGFDWRWIAALIFEESRFDPTSRSDKGAYGLMQVRPIAAEDVGAAEFKAPEDNVRTGVRYLRRLDGMFSQAQGPDRLCLVLAAYNMGPGHVRDAQLLARGLGYEPQRWHNSMELILPLLEEPRIYAQLPNGYARGHETVAYVERILSRYERYRLKTAGDAISSARQSGDG